MPDVVAGGVWRARVVAREHPPLERCRARRSVDEQRVIVAKGEHRVVYNGHLDLAL